MKTTNQLKAKHIFLKMLLMSAIFIAPKMNAQSDASYLSFQVSRDVTGSGLGGNVCPELALTYKQSTFSVGPNFQRKRMNLSGIQTNYRYSVVKSYNGKKEIFFCGNVTFQKSARMADSYIAIEKFNNSESTYDYNALRLKVIESYAGLGLKLNPTKQFSTFISVGIGMFDTMSKNYNKEMFREKSAVSMRMNFSLVYNFKTFTK